MKTEALENVRQKYQASLNLFISEGQNLWSRYNALLVVNTILLSIISFNFSNDPKSVSNQFQLFLKFIPFLGVVICGLWYVMTKRGFEYKRKWIKSAKELEIHLTGGINPIRDGNPKRSRFLSVEYVSYYIIVCISLIYVFLLLNNLLNP